MYGIGEFVIVPKCREAAIIRVPPMRIAAIYLTDEPDAAFRELHECAVLMHFAFPPGDISPLSELRGIIHNVNSLNQD